MNKVLIIALTLLVLAAHGTRAEQTIRLRVSATVLPRACEYPKRCEPIPATTKTKVEVDNGVIRYLGSPPEVTRKDDVLTVKF
jgi:hypothetical protein